MKVKSTTVERVAAGRRKLRTSSSSASIFNSACVYCDTNVYMPGAVPHDKYLNNTDFLKLLFIACLS